MSQAKTNVERLEEVGILKLEHFNDHDRTLIERLTVEEVEVLVKLRAKMGEAPTGKDHMRPNIVV